MLPLERLNRKQDEKQSCGSDPSSTSRGAGVLPGCALLLHTPVYGGHPPCALHASNALQVYCVRAGAPVSGSWFAYSPTLGPGKPLEALGIVAICV